MLAWAYKKNNAHLFPYHKLPEPVTTVSVQKYAAAEINGKRPTYKVVSKKAIRELGPQLVVGLHSDPNAVTNTTDDMKNKPHIEVIV